MVKDPLNPEQLVKAPEPIEVILLGISKDPVKPIHCQKASAPIEVIPVGMDKCPVRPVPPKQRISIVVMLFEIVKAPFKPVQQ